MKKFSSVDIFVIDVITLTDFISRQQIEKSASLLDFNILKRQYLRPIIRISKAFDKLLVANKNKEIENSRDQDVYPRTGILERMGGLLK